MNNQFIFLFYFIKEQFKRNPEIDTLQSIQSNKTHISREAIETGAC